MFNQYFQNILNTLKRGDSSEASFYAALETLLKNFAKSQKQIAEVTIIPRKTEAGIPDFVVRDKNLKKVGHIEAKDFQKYQESNDLDRVEDSEQLQKYRKNFANLILTNLFEFRLYRHGILVKKAQIGRPFIAYQLKIAPPVERKEDLEKLFLEFFAFSIPETKSAKSLALELAGRTAFLKEKILEEIEQKNLDILGFFQAFKEHLISSLSYEQFADLYAQTITYGLFIGRTRSNSSEFLRSAAVKFIPKTIPLLKKVFAFISSSDLPQSMEWIVDEIAQVLALADLTQIMREFSRLGKGSDPVIHFYETFLAEYDPKERERRGVYYTPEPVVSFIARSINQILKEKFDKPAGFAATSVTVLDPAAGTLTFPAQAIRIAKEESQKRYGEGAWHSLVKDHILKNFYGFELLMAPYAIGHLKISLLLEELGYHLSDDDKFNLYLTNTVDMKKLKQSALPFVAELSRESEDALKVKEDIPIMVIMGNPPYSGISENKGKWILEQIKEYKHIDGKSLGERNPKWIQDDYVKFFRFAQWKIERAGAGVLGFITNHGWLDNPTFRGMRYSLSRTFDEIYILNLHGSSRKKEKTPSGDKDENVFDIRSGVAIAVMVKYSQSISNPIIRYFDFYGLRQEKYRFLETHDIENTKWQILKPNQPNYFFVPQRTKGRKEYERFRKITDIFPINSVGIVTARDKFVIDFNHQALETRIRIFRESRDSDEFIKLTYNIEDKANWKVNKTRKRLRKLENWEDYFAKILYRPFDERWIYYHPELIERHREKVMRHMMRDNLALITHKREEIDLPYSHFLVTDKISEHGCLSGKTTSYQFPLYLYNNEEVKDHRRIPSTIMMLFDKPKNGYMAKKPNINPKLFEELSRKYNRKPSPEDIFYYIYAIFYSNVYRKKYQEFLRIDFPRAPFTQNYQLFKKMAVFGAQLVDLHLLRSNRLNSGNAKFYGESNNTAVKFRKYDQKNQRLRINEQKYFEPIVRETWEYRIGGYQVLDKWLKDKTGINLSADDIKRVCQITAALSETIKIQKQIDKIYFKIC